MASIILGQVGSMVGGQFGGAIGGMLGSYIDGMIFNHKNKLPWIDRQVTSATLGVPIPKAYGRCKLGGNLILSTPLRHTKKSGKGSGKGGGLGGSGSGKGGSKDRYYITCAVAVCEGEIDNIWRIWADSKLIWDMEPNSQTTFVGGLVVTGSGGSVAGSIGKGGGGGGKTSSQSNTSNSFGKATFYYGKEDQPVDATLDGIVSGANSHNESLSGSTIGGTGLCPAYRGLAYVVFQDFDVTNFGNRVPQFQFEVNGFYGGPKNQYNALGTTSILGSEFYDVVQDVFYFYTGGSSVTIYDARNTDRLQTIDLEDYSFINDAGEGGVGVWTGDMSNSMCDNQGTFLLPVPGQNQVSTHATPTVMVEITPTDGVTTAYAITDNPSGIRLGNTPGFEYYCGSTDMCLLAGSRVDGGGGAHNFLALDYSAGSPPTTAFAGHIVNGSQAIYDLQGDQLQLLTQVSTFGTATCIAYADVRREAILLDGYAGKFWVLDMDGTVLFKELFEGDVSGFHTSGRTVTAPWRVIFDSTSDNYVFWNEDDVVLVHSLSVGSPDAMPSYTHISTFTDMFGSMLKDANNFMIQQRPFGHMAALIDGSTDVRFFSTTDLSLNTEMDWSYSGATRAITVSGVSGPIYIPYGEGGLGYPSDSGFAVYMNTGAGLTLDVVVADVCRKAGLLDTQLDVSELGKDIVLGLPITAEINGRGIIETLEEIYMFDMVDTGQKLVGRKRSIRAATPVMTIDERDLAARPATSEPGHAPEQRLSETRKPDLDLPTVINLKYRTASGDYYVKNFSHAQATQMVRRNHNLVQGKTHVTVNTACVLSDQAAVQVAEMTLYQAYVQRTDFTFSLPLNYIALESGDNITLNWTDAAGDPRSQQLRITQLDLGADNTLKVQAHTNNLAAYIPHTVTMTSAFFGGRDVDNILSIYNGDGTYTGGYGGLTPDTTIGAIFIEPVATVPQRVPQASTLRFMEVPPLRDKDDDVGLYWSACGVGESEGWSMTLTRSKDNGVTFDTVGQTDTPGAIGFTRTALGTLGPPVPGLFDTHNTLQIELRSGTLASVDPKYAYENLALVGSEIIAFATATQAGDGTWTLSLLQRGLFGTDIYMDDHTAAEHFTLFSVDGSTINMDATLNDVGLDYRYAGTTTYGTIVNAAKKTYAMTGARIKPEAACHAQILRNSSGDATISWTPRRRIGIEWVDTIEYGVDEPVEGYEVDIFSVIDLPDMDGTPVATKTAWTVLTGTVGSQTGQDLGIRQISYPLAAQQTDGLVGSGATWATTAGFTLSSGDLITQRNSNTGFLTTTGGSGATAGLYYFEIMPGGLVNGDTSLGITDGTHTVRQIALGQLRLNGVNVVSTGGLVSGTRARFAVNLTTKRFWIDPRSTGTWNASGTANPETGVGGIDLSTFTGSVRPEFRAASNGENALANFGATAFVSTVPSGFFSGWPGPNFPIFGAAIYQTSNRIGRGFARKVTL